MPLRAGYDYTGGLDAINPGLYSRTKGLAGQEKYGY